jgi:hypothetical protein
MILQFISWSVAWICAAAVLAELVQNRWFPM